MIGAAITLIKKISDIRDAASIMSGAIARGPGFPKERARSTEISGIAC
jgi:hypothetical protein